VQRLTFTSLAAAAATLAWAAGNAVAQQPTTTQPTAPATPTPQQAQQQAQQQEPMSTTEVQQVGDVRYVTGGISVGDVQRTEELGRDMNLQMVFAQMGNGAYLADVDVTLHDVRGREVLRVEGADPLLFVRVPPGRYKVRAEVAGQPLERTVQVPANGRQRVVLHWRGEF
jgi:predicted membrane-bound mannosyltransferase